MTSQDKTAAIIAASDFARDKFEQMNEAGQFAYYVAVDGGYDRYAEMGFDPDFLLGDFDSLDKEPPFIRKARFPVEKDDSDLELTLWRMKTLGYEKSVVFGALGGRLDHTISNLRACAFANQRGMEVEIVGEREHIIFLSGENFWEVEDLHEYTKNSPATISIVPILSPVSELFIRGLKYESDDCKLDESGSLGLSNESTDEPILIGLKTGTVAIIINTL